jgi:stringent starvation protein B
MENGSHQGAGRVVSPISRMNGTPLPPKKEVALALLERGSVHVHLDPRAAGVVVPAWFKRQAQLVLQVGLNMPVPIPDLRVDDEGMSCTLSFNRSPFFCVVPWSSVYAMVGDDGRGMVWPEDVPPEVALQARARDAEPSKKPAAKRALSAVESPKQAPKPRAVRDATAPKTKKPRSKKSPAVAAGGAGRPGVVVAIPSKSPKRPMRADPPPESPPSQGAMGGRADPHPAPPPPARKPTGGKIKREIPPYLRVVK